MKRVLVLLTLLALTAATSSAQKKEQERVENARKVMKEILDVPEDIPQSLLNKAECAIVLTSVVKFAIGIGGNYGRGVMTCRKGESFKGSWGCQL